MKPKKAAPRMARKITREGGLTTETAGVYSITSLEARAEECKLPEGSAERKLAERGRLGAEEAMRVVLANLPKLPERSVGEWAQDIALRSRQALADAAQPDSVRVFAERCITGAQRVAALLHTLPGHQREVARAMEAAATLADDWHSLAANAALEPLVAARVNLTEGARDASTKRHWRNQLERKRRDVRAGKLARAMAGGLYERDAFLQTLAHKINSEFPRLKLRPSVLAKLPQVRPHVPGARRKRRA
jgi:hypothetical protein